MDVPSKPQEASVTLSVTKGTKVRVRRMTAKLVSLAGMQMKAGVTSEDFEGVVTHIYGDHPTNPTKIDFVVKKEDGSEVEVEQKHIVAVIEETKANADLPPVP